MTSTEQRKQAFLAEEQQRLQEDGYQPLENCITLTQIEMPDSGEIQVSYNNRKLFLTHIIIAAAASLVLLAMPDHNFGPGILLDIMVIWLIYSVVRYFDKKVKLYLNAAGFKTHRKQKLTEWRQVLDIFVNKKK